MAAARPRIFRAMRAALLAAAALGAPASAQQDGGGAGPEARAPWFEVERLRPETRDPPPGVSLTSPRETARSFFEAAANGRYADAAVTLRVPDDAAAEPEVLARMLADVLERRLWLRDGTLSSRADGAPERGGTERAPSPRRSVAFGTLETGRFPSTVRLERYRAGEAPPVWLFSEATVRAIPRLHARFGPGWLEPRLPEWWRRQTGLGVRRWEIAALPAVALGAWLVGWLVAAGLSRAEGLLSRVWMRRGAAAARLPLALLAGATAARLAVAGPLGFSAAISMVARPALVVVMVVAVVLAVLRMIDAALDVVTRRYVGEIDDRQGRDERHFYTSLYALRRLVTLLAVVGGTGAVLLELDLFGDIGLSLIASAGAATVILGIAAQTVLGNILASLQIAIAKPVRIGDTVLYDGRWAYVEAIYYTFIRLRTWDERRLIVPVQDFISRPFENWSMTDAKTTESFRLVVDHDADVAALRARFEALVEEDDDALPGGAVSLDVVDHDAAGAHLRGYATAADPSSAWTMHLRLREGLLAWIRSEHPEWWPRERVRDAEGGAGRAAGA